MKTLKHIALTLFIVLGFLTGAAFGQTVNYPFNGRFSDFPDIPRDIWALGSDNEFYLQTACKKDFNRTFQAPTLGPNDPIARANFALFPSEQLIGIDFRASNGLLYAVSSFGRIFIVDTVAPGRGGIRFFSTVSPKFPGGVQSLADFNAVADALRLIGSDGSNYAVTGAGLNTTVVQTSLTYAAGDVFAGQRPYITGGAYTNAVAAAQQTIFYVVDYNQHTVASPLLGGNGSSNTGAGIFQTIGQFVDERGKVVNITPTADLDIYTDPDGTGGLINYLVGYSGRTMFYLNVNVIPQYIPGQLQAIPVITEQNADGGWLDIAVSTKPSGKCNGNGGFAGFFNFNRR